MQILTAELSFPELEEKDDVSTDVKTDVKTDCLISLVHRFSPKWSKLNSVQNKNFSKLLMICWEIERGDMTGTEDWECKLCPHGPVTTITQCKTLELMERISNHY